MKPTLSHEGCQVSIYRGDCLTVLQEAPSESVDAIVTDPPYGLTFMGHDWDRGVPGVDLWVECLRVLKPGGHCLSFGGTRTYHRMACAIEDAGFEIRDQIQWLYGTGFPKSLNVGKAIDKAAGAEREVIGSRTAHDIRGGKMHAQNGNGTIVVSETLPATDAAKQWEGWGSALKPAHEPICLSRKPLDGTVIANVLAHGTGALNVDGTRITTAIQQHDAAVYMRLSSLYSSVCNHDFSALQLRDALRHIAFALRSCSNGDKGRWRSESAPRGSLLDHALCAQLLDHLYPNGVWCDCSKWSAPDSLVCCPACRRFYDEHIPLFQEAAQASASSLADVLERTGSDQLVFEHTPGCRCIDRPSNSDAVLLSLCVSFLLGSHSIIRSSDLEVKGRYPANVIHEGSDEVLAGFPESKVSGAARNGRPSKAKDKGSIGIGGNLHGTGTLHNDSGSAARFFYCSKVSPQERNGNIHPTMKPLDLIRYLTRLVTPPGGIILDPFMGSGTTGVAALLEGFGFFGIEQDPEYFDGAADRIRASIIDCEGGELFQTGRVL